MSDSGRITRLGRRGFVKALTALGVSSEAARSMSGEDLTQLTEDPSNEVPIIRRYKHVNHESGTSGEEPLRREPIYGTVPRDQWIRVNTALDAVSQIRSKLRNSDVSIQDSGPTQVEVGITNRVENADLGVVVKGIEYIDKSGEKLLDGPGVTDIEEVVPYSITGKVKFDNKVRERMNIPVKIEESRVEEQGTFEDKYRPVPGGCEMWDGGTYNGLGWTNGTAAQDDLNDGQSIWLTAAHCLERSVGRSIHQSSEGTKVGESGRNMPASVGDAGVIEPTSANVSWDIADYSGKYKWPIKGMVNNYSIQYMVDNSDTACFQGVKTGRDTSATVLDFIPESSSNPNGDKVVLDHDSDNGDSGGPYFDLLNDEAYIMGIHAWAEGADDAKGNTIEWIEDELVVTV